MIGNKKIKDEVFMCNGKPCLYPNWMKQWQKAISSHDGSYPDPIDNSPCDSCERTHGNDNKLDDEGYYASLAGEDY